MADTYTPAELVAMAWDRGETLSADLVSKSDQKFDSALAAADSWTPMTAAQLNFTPMVVEPLVNIPAQAEGASMEVFDTWWNEIADGLGQRFAGFITQYFPNETQYFQSAQAWLENAITNGGTGIKASVESQIWERDRSRVLRDADRAQADIVAAYAARGFPVPPGAMLKAVANSQQDAQDQIARASRDVAIKQAEMEIDNVRFAVQQAISLWGTAMNAAKDYISALASAASVSAQILPSVSDSQARLISAASSYYQARIAVQDLRLRAATPNAEFQQQAAVKNLDAQIALIQATVDAAKEAARSLATQAAAALNALNVSASASAGGSTSVSYSYSNDTQNTPPGLTSV